MDQSIFPFILIFIAMSVIAFSLIFYVRRKGKNSKGVYTAKAMEFITKKYPSINTSNIKCVEFYISKGRLGQIDPALIAYNDEDLYIISALPQPIPGFYRIISNEQAEWDMFYYPMTSIEQAGFDEQQKHFILIIKGESIKLKIRKRNTFQEDQQEEINNFFATISQAIQKNTALNV
jgi:hypothetical protein